MEPVVMTPVDRTDYRQLHRRAVHSARYWHRGFVTLSGRTLSDRAEAAYWLDRAGDFRRRLAAQRSTP
jgi:hypothetical protein